jgi:hypothetical protein
MQREVRRELGHAVMEHDAVGENLFHHGGHVVGLERNAQRLVTHAAAGAVVHFGVLQVITRLRKKPVIARVIIVHVRDDHVCDAVRIDADHPQPFAHWTQQRALPFGGTRSIEAGVEHEALFVSDNGPDKEVQRHGAVVRIATEEIVRCRSVVMGVADGEQIIGIVHEAVLGWSARTSGRSTPR